MLISHLPASIIGSCRPIARQKININLISSPVLSRTDDRKPCRSTRGSAIAERPARRSVLVEMLSYRCTNSANRSLVSLRSTFSRCHFLFGHLHSFVHASYKLNYRTASMRCSASNACNVKVSCTFDKQTSTTTNVVDVKWCYQQTSTTTIVVHNPPPVHRRGRWPPCDHVGWTQFLQLVRLAECGLCVYAGDFSTGRKTLFLHTPAEFSIPVVGDLIGVS